MKKQILILNSLLIAVALMIGVIGCKKSSTTTTFGLSSLKADAVDMNGAAPPSNVSNTPTIVAGFTVDVNASTVTSARITLVRDYDQANIALTLKVVGSTITIVPQVDLGNGALYKLSFLGGIQSSDGQFLPAFNRAFTTLGTFVPSGMVAYWNFENNAVNDLVGTHNSTFSNIGFASSYSAAAGMAGSFDGTSSIAEVPDGANHDLDNMHSFTITFWVKAISLGHVDSLGNPKGQFVIGLGAFYGYQFEMAGDYSSCKLAATYNVGDTATTSEDLWFNGQPLTPTSWQGWTFSKDLTGSGGVAGLIKDKWAAITCTYDGDTKIGTMYINGEKMKAQDFNLWPAGDKKLSVTGIKFSGTPPQEEDILAFGFIKSRGSTFWNENEWSNYSSPYANHFGGLLDDVRIFKKALTAQEVSLMYNSEKP